MNEILGQSQWNNVKSENDFGLVFILGLEDDVSPKVTEKNN